MLCFLAEVTIVDVVVTPAVVSVWSPSLMLLNIWFQGFMHHLRRSVVGSGAQIIVETRLRR
jgi:hypothetical protein